MDGDQLRERMRIQHHLSEDFHLAGDVYSLLGDYFAEYSQGGYCSFQHVTRHFLGTILNLETSMEDVVDAKLHLSNYLGLMTKYASFKKQETTTDRVNELGMGSQLGRYISYSARELEGC